MSRISILRTTVSAFVLFGFSAFNSAFAQDAGIDEVRFGGTWAQPVFLDGQHAEKDQFGINAEVLFTPFDWDFRDQASDDLIHTFLTPRFHIGGLAVLEKDSTSYVYAGLTWHQALGEIFFVEGGFGGSVNNGSINATPTRAALGSNILFRESFAVGVNVGENATVVGQIEHTSHAGLAGSSNRGLTNMSVRLGYKF